MTYLSYYYLFIYLTGRVIDSERERDREKGLPSIGSLPKWLQWLALRRSEARSQVLLPGLLWGAGPKHLGHPPLPSQATAESWTGRGATETRTRHPYGMLALQVED